MDAAEDMKLLGKGQRTLLLKVEAAAVALPLFVSFSPRPASPAKDSPIMFACTPRGWPYRRGTQRLEIHDFYSEW